MNGSRCSAIIVLVCAIILLSACSTRPLNYPTLAQTSTQTTEPSSTPLPQTTLTICLGQEPASLYPFGILSASSRSVLAAIYDGPIDSNSYGYQAVILQKLPDLEDGDALLETVTVKNGDEIVAADGLPVVLSAGVRLHPAGCQADDCAITYDGVSEIAMNQLVVNFSLLPGLTWSDGNHLTADDSVFSFELASNPDTLGSRYLIDRTQSYEAVDDLTVQWWGLPGYMDPVYYTNFYAPAPRHAWQDFSAADLPGEAAASRTPIGWGAYVVDEWVSGESIHLVKNPHYFRSGEGLPEFDELIFRFVSDDKLAISQLIAGACDLLDPDIPLDNQVELLYAFDANGQLDVKVAPSMNLEQLDFGIQPAAYDDGFSLASGDRPDLFGDKRTRQAIAFCLDRQKVVDEVLFGLSELPSSFIPSGHPLYNEAISKYPYDIHAGSRLLDEVGWKDHDNDPATARQAQAIPGVPDGTELKLGVVTTGALQRRQVSEILANSLVGCGIRLDIQYLDPLELYQVGEQGTLFGRNFDLAEFAMASISLEPPCNWYTSSEIPAANNNWMGINFSAYTDPTYDAACQAARNNLGQDVSRESLYADVQKIFSDDLPVIPLYWQVKVAATRVGLCGFWLDPTSTGSLWNIEALKFSYNCLGE